VLRGIAARHHATAAQVALAWVLSHTGVHAHPRAATPAHLERNRGALELRASAPTTCSSSTTRSTATEAGLS
jgi:diketogulonate reductase-like aldo/keto reductase